MDMKDDKAFEDKIERAVSNSLEKEPGFELPAGFADRMVSMIGQGSTVKESQRDRWWLVAGIVSMIGTLVYALLSVDFKASVGVFTFFSGYWGLVVFGVAFVIGLHIIDKRVLRHQ